MYPRVLREVARVCEGLVALRAFVRLRLPHVDLRVHLQVRLRTEDLQQEEENGRGLGTDQCQCYHHHQQHHHHQHHQHHHKIPVATEVICRKPHYIARRYVCDMYAIWQVNLHGVYWLKAT